MNLIKDTKNNPNIDVEFFKNLNGKTVQYTWSDFHSKFKNSQNKDANFDDEPEEEPPDEPVPSAEVFYKIHLDNKKLILENTDFSKTNIKSITIPLDSKLEHPFIVETNERQIKETLVHFSYSEDLNLFSFLVKTENSLITFNFEVKSERNIKYINPHYFYMFAKGAKIGWNKSQPLIISICGKLNAENTYEIMSYIKDWSNILKRSNLKIEINFISENYLPFSDFNQHCIQIVDDFLAQPNLKDKRLATARMVPNFNSGTIVDGDIFVWNKEFQKFGLESVWRNEFLPLRRLTFLHELGHFLGLSHKFTKGLIPSIMSYLDTDGIQKYDREAITALYAD